GPRAVGRLWDRHLLNSAVVDELVPPGVELVDVGSGAGLPGIPLALARPDLRVVLLEPMLRRCVFLEEAVTELGLAARVSVVRGRAPDAVTVMGRGFDVAVARAVAPLERLAAMVVPLIRPGGVLLALRGARAAEELDEVRDDMAGWGVREASVVRCGVGRLTEPTTVLRAVRAQGAVHVDGTVHHAGGTSRAGRRDGEAGRDKRARGKTRST
ncbi:MAG: 16S rRNA (guanine(527)-N(7))-methyltransferase RsmG, partial [Frankia sp.]